MKVLVIGSGGREHALVWKIRQSPRVTRVYCAPGNAGIGGLAELVALTPDDVHGLRRFAEQERIDLTVVGPELPLSLGLVDEFEVHGLRVFGPNRQAAQLEASKAFAKEIMRKQGVPTAYFGVFTESAEARRYVSEVGAPVVVKADGLAAGKGVFICSTVKEAHEVIDEIMHARLFGDAGDRVVVEEFLEGEEASFLAFVDGTTVLPLASAQDHKRVFDGDQGPNTGGMGAYSPAPLVTQSLAEQIVQGVMLPVVRELKQRKITYKGILYANLMINQESIKVLEFNVRFGDPECQPLMLRLQSDLVEVMEAVINERLVEVTLSWDPRPAVCVVLAVEGYPGTYETGKPISGLESLRTWKEGVVFHAGTANVNGAFVTKGGRVLGVTATGAAISDAIAAAYWAVGQISWPGMQYRRDIGQRALTHLSPEQPTGER
ncbi:MAG TPA: phosphoribosylamine--glycine ligase [Candidatus Binatia bacterium]|jgi:phosphoribosylamine--glycine ligase|nr:phosphoribosylamine--glycine ligase [Candidatus Binatia bacterium]